MSVISVTQPWDGRGGNANVKWEQKATRVLIVQTDNYNDDEWSVLTSGYVPTRFAPHPGNPYLLARDVNCAPHGNSRCHWKVTINYDNQVDPAQNEENPLLRPGIDEWSFAQYQTIAVNDRDGKPIRNTVEQPFDPPVEKDESRLVLVYSRNEAYFPVALAEQYMDAINSDTFCGRPAGHVKCQNINATKQFENGTAFYATRYEFHFNGKGWDKEILNRGTRYRLEAGGPYVHLTPGLEPILLKANGTKLPDGSDPAAADYVTAKVYDKLPFSVFNISL